MFGMGALCLVGCCTCAGFVAGSLDVDEEKRSASEFLVEVGAKKLLLRSDTALWRRKTGRCAYGTFATAAVVVLRIKAPFDPWAGRIGRSRRGEAIRVGISRRSGGSRNPPPQRRHTLGARAPGPVSQDTLCRMATSAFFPRNR